MAARRGNILFIVVDQWRGDTLGALGHLVRTPHLDRLAAEGTLFTRHYAQSSPCGPSRASLATGQYLMSHRVVTNDTPTSRHLKTLPWFLRDAGYDPALIGYTTTVPDPRGADSNDPRFHVNTVADGWTVICDFEGDKTHYLAYLTGLGYDVTAGYDALFQSAPGTDESQRFGPSPIRPEHADSVWCVDAALDYIRIRRGEPWFLHLGIYRPHPPFMASTPWHAMYDPAAMPPPLEDLPEAGPAHPLTRLLHDTVAARDGVYNLPGLAADLNAAAWRKLRAAYYGLCSEVDAQLGRVFELLRASGQDEHTLIVLTSDHGEQLGDHRLLGKLGYFPQSYHIPCIVRDPHAAARTRGGKVTHYTENVDLLPTLLAWLEQPLPHQCDGRSLLPFVHGAPPPAWRDAAHWEYDFRDLAQGQAAARLGIGPDDASLAVMQDDRYAYVHCAALPPLLFDLQRDPHWQHNLADDSAHAAAALRCARRMLDWRLSHADRTLTGLAISPSGLTGQW